ncbi:MAG TPA: SMC family ATPase, partial [Aggregatilineales bacterium]|nr:SMC family ATPase [Aggregatilineales bacterium]
LPQTEARIKQLEERAEAQTSRLDELCAMLDEISQEREVVALKEEELSSWEGRLQDLRDQSWQAQSMLGAAQQRLNTIATQRERRKQVLKQLDDLADEQGVYEQLRDAFGKDGIPAMIIEAAIPEIETEANELLARMTDGRMHVRFDTQREKVTGGFKETLDIKIADELGTRDYETFSGGEAFRVNFAIRLALSRLLARRAGAQLRTLIMDEGFGTQDAQGRERLVQAINAIRDDFDLILVITHIDELRDAFPVRIEVTKRPTGSVIDIV